MTDLIWLGLILALSLVAFLLIALLGDPGSGSGAGGGEGAAA